MAKIKLTGLTKIYSTRHEGLVALNGVDLSVEEGQFVCIVGPSGCGKTTLLRLLASLEMPTSGKIEIEASRAGRPLTGMVFQNAALLPWLTVADNVGYGLAAQGIGNGIREAAVHQLLSQVGLTPFAESFPHQLSGGMRQRVGIARALAYDPEVLLMDEPFGALDAQTRLLMQEELLALWESRRKTVLFVTHSLDEALTLGDRVIVMSARPGRILRQIDVPFGRPRHLRELRADARFGQLVADLWDTLRTEVLKVKQAEAHLEVAV